MHESSDTDAHRMCQQAPHEVDLGPSAVLSGHRRRVPRRRGMNEDVAAVSPCDPLVERLPRHRLPGDRTKRERRDSVESENFVTVRSRLANDGAPDEPRRAGDGYFHRRIL